MRAVVPQEVLVGILLGAILLMPVAGSTQAPPMAPAAGHPSFTPLTVSASGLGTNGPWPLNVSFSAIASGGWTPYQYNWSFGDGSPNSTGPSVAHVYRWVASFTANVTVVDAFGEIATDSVLVTTQPLPLLVGLSANPATVALGATTFLETIVAGGTAPFQYRWSGLPPGCVALPVENLSCPPTAPGTFTVHVVVTDGSGQMANSSTLLQVIGTLPPTGGSSTGGSPLAGYWALAIIVGVVVVLVVALIVRRSRRRGPPAER